MREDQPPVKLVLTVPADLHRAAGERARAEDRSLAALVRVALRAYLAEGSRAQTRADCTNEPPDRQPGGARRT